MQLTIRQSGRQQYLDEIQRQQLALLGARPKTRHHLIQRKICLLAQIELANGLAALVTIQTHARHQRFRLGDLVFADAAIRLGEMPQDGKHRLEQRVVEGFTLALAHWPEWIPGLYLHRLPVDLVTDEQADDTANGAENQKAQPAENDFSCPDHAVVRLVALSQPRLARVVVAG
nr:hypothetical protein MERC5_00045 [uncultured bacterium]